MTRPLVALLTVMLVATASAGETPAASAAANTPATVPVAADPAPDPSPEPEAGAVVAGGASLGGLPAMLGDRPWAAAVPSALLLGVATIAPAILLMTTSFVRMSVVLSLVRQGLGAPQVPSNQIVAALALFLSGMVMWPVWTQTWQEGVAPYQEGRLTAEAAFERGSLPIRRWMATQIERAGNRDTMLLFLARHPAGPREAATYDDVPLETLLPAFLVSELEVAFMIGFRLLLPFLVLDILVATLAASTGLVMLPPTVVSLPLKLLVFVTADGWTLVVRALLDGVAAS